MDLNSNHKNFSRTVKCQWCTLYKQRAINLCFIPHSPPPSLSLFFPKPLLHNGISQRWWRSTQRWQVDLPSHGVCRRHYSLVWRLSSLAASLLSMSKFIALSLLKDASDMVLRRRRRMACYPAATATSIPATSNFLSL